MKKQLSFLLLLTSLILISCGDDEQPSDPVDNFDRKGMLTNWADNIIVPAFTNFAEKTAQLKSASNTFTSDPNLVNYQSLATHWETAYFAFQDVSMFDVGKAGELRMTYNLNIYPTNVDEIIANILNENYNLLLPSKEDQQGFPALDYLLFGVASDEVAILDFYQNDTNANKYLNYIKDLTDRIDNIAQEIITDWQSGFRDEFINSSGNSATASANKMTNDFMFYYEKHLRAGKIGIPAGVFQGGTNSGNVEAFYKGDISKGLFFRGLDAVENFFNGVHYNDNTQSGESFNTYIEYLEVMKNNKSLATLINEQFLSAKNAAAELGDNFVDQVENDNIKMLATYDQLQLNVPNMKVDMIQAMDISIDYIDADGD